MIIIPCDVKCRFCSYTFCCKNCRVKHEEKEHNLELIVRKQEEYILSNCFICNGQQLPSNPNEKPSFEMLQHIQNNHLPLKCFKCEKVFERLVDLDQIGKCCSNQKSCDQSKSNEEENNDDKLQKNCENDGALTPLSKINLRWRRKSKEFNNSKPDDGNENLPDAALKRQTSTPMQETFDTPSSIQISSICVSSSNESSECTSPPVTNDVVFKKPPSNLSLSPSHAKRNTSQSKSRQKMHVQNTPLRQVMTKSIQRAIATQGYHKNTNLQQRKMNFDSSNSSNEATISLMKIHCEDNISQPLDLRLSPAIRRESQGDEVIPKIEEKNCEIKSNESILSVNRIQVEEIQVIIRRSEICSESSIMTNYKSCCSDNRTPRTKSNNILKKTISFDTPSNIDKTPSFLIGKKSRANTDADSENEDDEVFYTPYKFDSPERRTVTETSPEKENFNNQETCGKSKNFWNMFTSTVAKYTSGSTSSSNSESKWGFSLQKPKYMLKVAADFFGSKSSISSTDSVVADNHEDEEEEEEEIQALKRRRPSSGSCTTASNLENIASQITSPVSKRRRIQSRKPIDRMLTLS